MSQNSQRINHFKDRASCRGGDRGKFKRIQFLSRLQKITSLSEVAGKGLNMLMLMA